ncbi:PREDICTED: protein GLUTAMINE DUMPER 5-like [Tarenaya hassleriana]|uniref:protein GLUTAMINE DUMPER 5-like n=1 Tax=Tarenaya hassleriana TaxID=28532 RepID=UPI00053C836F|nr:PREDICTED: protein GLUTAMINE DUMPER 5-like [Tarenaya hassleriana]
MRQFPIKANTIKFTTMAKPGGPAFPDAPSPATTQPRPLWLSPVPYLFGGLAAMLGLIAFALLLLACSYWRLSDHGGDGDRLGDSGEKVSGKKVYDEEILVIMAGEEKPTFLATPVAIATATKTPESGGIVNKEGKEGQNRESGVLVPTGTEESSGEENH